MDVKFDIPQYFASVKMSSKKRVLVEGRDDKAHISNLFFAILGNNKIKIDTAENIKGVCGSTSKNNRAKIDLIHQTTKTTNHYENLYFLCDREYLKFNIGEEIQDLMDGHESDGNLSWTLGHSLENYFLEADLISDAFSYLTGSEFKVPAVTLFNELLPSALQIIAAITLSARDIGSSTYPIGSINWKDFHLDNNILSFDAANWIQKKDDEISKAFYSKYFKYLSILVKSKNLICSRICRGHTSILMLQRIFSACLYKVGNHLDEFAARRDANSFCNIRELSVSNALSEAWIRKIKTGNALYPANLVVAVT